MNKALALASAVTLSIAMTGIAEASSKLPLNDQVKSQIKTMLEKQDYKVGKIKVEDGLYEAYAKKDGERFEVLVNDHMEIVKVYGGE